MRSEFFLIDDREKFIADWARLHARSSSGLFLSPAWIGGLMEQAGAAATFGAVRVFDDLRGVFGMALIGIAPRGAFTRLREARLNESGLADLDRIYIEYNDVMLAERAVDGAREEVVTTLIETLAQAGVRADQLVFRNVRPKFASAIEAAASGTRLDIETLQELPTFQIDLAAPLDGTAPDAPLIERLSSSLRAKIRRSIRRYEARGALLIEQPDDDAARAVAWTELLRLHAETWSRRGVKGVFHGDRVRRFHERLIERHPDHVDFLRLRAGSETIGVLYNLIDGDRIMNYQSGFRYEADNQLAPGFVAHLKAAERYREAGYEVYDMMAGDADYKRRLGSEGETLRTIALTRRGLRARLRAGAKSLRPARSA